MSSRRYTNFLLTVIATCLVVITAQYVLPSASAAVAGMDYDALKDDYDFKKAVKSVVEDNCKLKSKDIDMDYKEVKDDIRCR